MMADVQLLGAHVDHLIHVQQRLLDKPGTAGEGEAGSRSKSWPQPAPFDSVDRWATSAASAGATGAEAAWPSQPYDPGRYSSYDEASSVPSEVEGICGETGPGVHSARAEKSKDTAELHSAVDSLERRSLLFQRRIRDCAQNVAERRREGQGVPAAVSAQQ